MAKGRFSFTLPHIHIGVCTSMSSFGHTFLKYAQNAFHRRPIERTQIEKAPIFIVGHWRTGTTLLHEMMIQDQRHNYPTTYQCLNPNHFLLTERLFKRWLQFMLPERRPMDNMAVGWDKPQEDEFALCLLGQPSPYLDLIFPNRPPLTPGALDLEGLSPRQKRDWQRTLLHFLKTLTCKDRRRLVLKSPPHSCRIPTLLEMFPDARFVHIVRNPYKVFPSTVKLWKSLAEKHCVQTPHHRHIEEKVFSTFTHLYRKLEEGRKLVSPSRFHELKYEDLVRDPEREMKRLYSHLDLGGFEQMRPRLLDYLALNANYETNKFQLPIAKRDEITRRWGDVIRQYGYPIDADEDMPPHPMPLHRPAEDMDKHPDILRFPTQLSTNTGAPLRVKAM